MVAEITRKKRGKQVAKKSFHGRPPSLFANAKMAGHGMSLNSESLALQNKDEIIRIISYLNTELQRKLIQLEDRVRALEGYQSEQGAIFNLDIDGDHTCDSN